MSAFGFDLIDDPYLARAAVRIFIPAEVFLGQLVDVRKGVGTLLRDIRSAPTNRQMTVRILRIEKVQSNARIAPHIFVFDTAFRNVDQDVPSISINPDAPAWLAIWDNCASCSGVKWTSMSASVGTRVYAVNGRCLARVLGDNNGFSVKRLETLLSGGHSSNGPRE